MARRTPRFGIGAKVLLGLGLTLAVVGLSFKLSLARFQELRGSFDQVAREELPLLIVAAELVQESTLLLTHIPEILVARSSVLFASIKDHIEGSVARSAQLIAALEARPERAGQTAELTVQNARMAESLRALIALKEEHLSVLQRSERLFRRLDRITGEIDELTGAAPWRESAGKAARELLKVDHIERATTLAQARARVAEMVAEGGRLLEEAGAAPRAALLIQSELRDYALGEEGLFALRERELRLAERMEENLHQGRFFAGALLKGARDLFENSKAQTLKREEGVDRLLAEVSRTLTLLAAVSLLSLLAVHLFVRGSVIARILRLQRAINRSSEAGTHAVPVEGRDEIALMAEEVNFFLREIESRERGLREAVARAEEASRAKGEFLANVSHEIRTPMNAIIHLTRFCLEGDLPPAEQARLEKVVTAAEALLALLNDILDLSKIEAGHMGIESIPFTPQELLLPLEPARERARVRGLRFTVTVDPAMPPALRGDPLRIGQVLGNLVDNALKFTERGELAIGLRALPGEGERVDLEIAVSDTGIGIPPGRAEALFAPFAQADSSTTRRYGGTGLGLAICNRLVAAMGGRIGVESRPGEGSRFCFSVPLARADAEELAERERAAPGGGRIGPERLLGFAGRRVLLVEDNPFNQEVARELLAAAGLEVALAGNGREAVEMAAAGGFDLVLMDLQMPEMDGFEATRRMRAGPWGAELPIVALTASALPETPAHCREAGMDDLLVKPIDAGLLYEMAAHWLARGGGRPVAVPPAPLSPSPRLARLFRATHADAPARLAAALGAGDAAVAGRLAHDLKSAAATLGAGELTALARRAETLLRGGGDQGEGAAAAAAAEAAALLPEIARALEGLLARLPQELPPAPAGADRPDPADALPRLEELLTALRQHRARSVRLCEALVADCGGSPLGAALGSVRDPLDRFDFEAAAGTVEGLIRERVGS